jgi:hypothetical protein
MNLFFLIVLYTSRSRDIAIGIVTDWTVGVRFPARASDFCFLYSVYTSSEANQDSNSMNTVGSFPWDKAVSA